MNSDIRIAVGWADHPKTERLARACGPDACRCLIRLWSWTACNRPTGDMAGLTDEDLEIAAGWRGDAGKFITALRDLRWVDGEAPAYQMHEWAEHESWASAAPERSETAREAGKASGVARRRNKNERNEQGVRIPFERNTNGNEQGVGVVLNGTRTPSPSPSPSPKEKREDSQIDVSTSPSTQDVDTAGVAVLEALGIHEPTDNTHTARVTNAAAGSPIVIANPVRSCIDAYTAAFLDATGSRPTWNGYAQGQLAHLVETHGESVVLGRLAKFVERYRSDQFWNARGLAFPVFAKEFDALATWSAAPAKVGSTATVGDDHREAQAAWQEVLAAVRREGRYCKCQWTHPATTAAVRACGGYASVCETPEGAAQGALRKRFVEAWEEAGT